MAFALKTLDTMPTSSETWCAHDAVLFRALSDRFTEPKVFLDADTRGRGCALPARKIFRSSTSVVCCCMYALVFVHLLYS